MAKNKLRISIVMVDGSFRERFHSIDFLGNQTMPPDDYEFIWVEHYDRVDPALQRKMSQYPNSRIMTLKRNGLYHSSHCFNAGILASRGELIIVMDADVVVKRQFLEGVWLAHEENGNLVMYVHRYNEPKEKHIPEVNLKHLEVVCRLKNPSNYGACLTVRKKWLLHINGYEQHPLFASGFHANGLDVYTRLKNLGLHVRWHPELKLYHPFHPLTSVRAPVYELQRIIVDYRAVSLSTSPFEGIDPGLNTEIPEDLLAKIEEAGRRHGLSQFFDSDNDLVSEQRGFRSLLEQEASLSSSTRMPSGVTRLRLKALTLLKAFFSE